MPQLSDVQLIIHMKITFDPKDRKTFLGLFKPVYDKVVAEPECAYVFVGEVENEPGTVRLTEGWKRDHDWLMKEQLTKPYYAPYMKASASLFTAPPVVELCTPLESLNQYNA